MSTRIPNSPPLPGPAPVPPAPPDGKPYRYGMTRGGWHGYADTAEELAALLITGYELLAGDSMRLRARIGYGAGVRIPIQARVTANRDLGACTAEQRAIVLGTRDTPPPVTEWLAPVPLVLVSSFYAPGGLLQRPVPAPGCEIIWIDPQTCQSLLTSLHAAGWISLASCDHGPATGPGMLTGLDPGADDHVKGAERTLKVRIGPRTRSGGCLRFSLT